MTEKDIIVGGVYKRGNDRYLGIGKRQMGHGDFSNKAPMEEKHLICLDGDMYCGLIVKSGDDAIGGFWSGFQFVGMLTD